MTNKIILHIPHASTFILFKDGFLERMIFIILKSGSNYQKNFLIREGLQSG